MFILLISLISAFLISIIIYFLFGIIASILPFFIFSILFYFLLLKRISKKLENSMLIVQHELKKQNVLNAINMLLKIKDRFKNWQFFTKSTIDGQIGSLHYMNKNYSRSKPYLKKAFSRHWVAKAMLAILYYKKKKYEKMNKVFEFAVKYSPKQGLLWNIWAYCLLRLGKNNQAINILIRGKHNLGDSDKYLNQNLINLQNKKKLKMKVYGEQWYQFHLELSPRLKNIRAGGVKFSRH